MVKRLTSRLAGFIMLYTESKLALVLSFALCCVNTFTVVFTPAIVPFLIASHTSWRGQSLFSLRTQLVTFWSALGAAAGAGALHLVTTVYGREFLSQYLPASFFNPTGQVSEWMREYGALGAGFCAFFPGPMQPAIIVAALLKCNILAVILCVFVGRYPKNLLLFESSARGIQGTLYVGKAIAKKSKA
jgi:membrane protein DedA with SNARE-associated domain